MEKTKVVPLRMCIVCKEMMPKMDLIRIVRNKDGEYILDYTLKANGRGAYLCKKEECFKKCIDKKLLNRTFKENVSQEIYVSLSEEYEQRKNS